MNKQYRKIVVGAFAVLTVMAVILGWQPIKAAGAKVYYSVAANSGLIGYWNFDDCDSCLTAKDYSGNVAAGDLTGGATRITSSRIKGNALDLNGSNGYVNVPDDADWAFGTGDFSISTWVNFDSVRAGNSSSIPNIFVAQDEGGGATNKWIFFLADSTTVYFHINAAGPSTFITGPNIAPVTGRWYNLVVTRSGGSSYSFYVDGELRTTASDSQSVPNANVALTIGVSEGTGYLDGKQDEIRIYNRTISAGEVKHLYEQARAKTAPKPTALSGLVGYWNFDDCDSCTAVKDYSVSGSTGTMYNAAGPTAGNLHTALGKVGNAAAFDGIDDYVGVDDSFLPTGAGSRSVSLWFKTSVTPGGSTAGLVSYGSTAPANQQYYILIYNGTDCTGTITSTGGRYGLAAGTGGTGSNVCDDTSVIDGIWHNVVTTYDGTTHKIYLDGTLRSSRSQTPNTVSIGAGGLHLGDGRGGDFLNGSIDQVRMYNRALSEAEVMNLYHDTAKLIAKAPPLNGLAGFWNFDDCDTCSAAKDYSGNGNDGTTYSAAGPAVGDIHTKLGKIGNSGIFDGTNDFVQIADATSLKPTSVTVSAWVNLTSLTTNATCGGAPNTLQYFVFKRNTRVSSDEAYALLKYIDGSSNPQFDFTVSSSGGTQDSAASVTIPTTGRWYHLVGTFEQPTVNLYIDGKLEGTATHNLVLDHHTRPVFIGRTGECGGAGETNFDAYANAKIDEVRIYNRALSVAEVQALYRAGR